MKATVTGPGVAALLAVALGVSIAGSPRAIQAARVSGIAQAAATQPTLGDIKSVDEFRTLFDSERGKYRVVLLLSPT